MVSAMGAMRSLVWLKMLRVVSSMKSTIISTKFCKPPGTPDVAFRAAVLKIQMNATPVINAQTIESTLMAQKPISFASAAECANPHDPSACCP